MDCARLLHELHQAGYHHGDLTADKLLSGVYGISFVGFSKLRKAESMDEKMDEFGKLARILNEIQEDYLERVKHKRVKRSQVDTESPEVSSSSQYAASAILLGPFTGDPISFSSHVARQTGSRLRVMIKRDFLYFEFSEAVETAADFVQRTLTGSYEMVPRQILTARQINR
jgi:hypothetical protein